MFDYVKTEKTDFLLLNDIIPDQIGLGELTDFISQYMSCAVYRIDELTDLLKPLAIDSKEIIAIGDGGDLVSRKLLTGREYKKLTIYRKWRDGNYDFHYDIPFSSLGSSNVQIIDDVVASGETLSRVREILDPLQLRAFSATVLIAGGNFNNKYRTSDGGVYGYDSLVSALLVLSDSEDDPYWYPAIYSMRHLLFKQEQNPHYLERMSKRYFNGDSGPLERILDSMRNMSYLDFGTGKALKP